MVMAFRGQGFFLNNHAHYFNKVINILMAFFSPGKVFLEFAGTERFKHELAPQIREQILKRLESLGGNLTPHHGPAFPNSGGSFGVKAQFPGFRITVFGAQRTLAFKVKTIISGAGICRGCRSKSKYIFSQRYLTGNINNQPSAGRYLYRLRNAHKINVA
jgi:hypothetical protein